MQANKITGAIITGGREENSFMTMQMMAVFGEGALDMYLLNEWGNSQVDPPMSSHNIYFHSQFDVTGWAINVGQSPSHTHFQQQSTWWPQMRVAGCQNQPTVYRPQYTNPKTLSISCTLINTPTYSSLCTPPPNFFWLSLLFLPNWKQRHAGERQAPHCHYCTAPLPSRTIPQNFTAHLWK